MAIHVHLDCLGEPTDVVGSSQFSNINYSTLSFSWESVITSPFSLNISEELDLPEKYWFRFFGKIAFYPVRMSLRMAELVAHL